MITQRATQPKYKYLLNPIVDDYNIRDDEFYKRVKHISAFYDLKKTWERRFAWKPVRSDKSGVLIWFTDYWVLKVKVENHTSEYSTGFDRSWELCYTRDEYILEKLGVK